MKSLEERSDGVTKTKFVKAIIIIITTTITIIIIIIIIIIIVVIIIMKITQIEILQPTIHCSCPVASGNQSKSCLFLASPVLFVEPNSAKFWMRAIIVDV